MKSWLLAVAIGFSTFLSCTLTMADDEEKRAGGINFDFRKNLCKTGKVGRSYDLANRRLSSNVRLLSVRWYDTNPFEIEYDGKTYEWAREPPAGVCEEIFDITPESGEKRMGEHVKVFHDGCSGEWWKDVPPNRMGANTWGKFFHASCVRHDHCYHHESSSNGRDQKWCDEQMLVGNRNLCHREFQSGSKDHGTCMKASEKQYLGVRFFRRGKYFDQMDVNQNYRALYERK